MPSSWSYLFETETKIIRIIFYLLFCALCFAQGCSSQRASKTDTQSQSLRDSELKLFDQAQATMAEYFIAEDSKLSQLDPEVGNYAKERHKLNTTSLELQRLVFVYRQAHAPEEIKWNDPYNWGFYSTAEYETCKQTIPGFKQLTERLEKQKEFLKSEMQLLKRRNQIYNTNKESFYQLEKCFHDQLMNLQKKMDELHKNPPPRDAGR